MKINLFIAMAVLMICGCSQFTEHDAAPSCTINAPASIEATIEEPQESTRTYVDNDNTLHWTANDEISYFPGVAVNMQYRFSGETGAIGGSFDRVSSESVSGTALSCNYALYPYDKSTSVATNGCISYTLPDVQYYAEESFGLGANVMVAATKDTNDNVLRFKNACGYLEIQLYGTNAKVKSITFRGNKDEKIAGAATITARYEQNPTIEMSNEATTSVTLDCSKAGGVLLSSDSSKPTSFWFVLPEMTFTDGFTIVVTGVDGGTFTKSTSKSITIERNMIQPMAAFKTTLASEGIDIVDNKVRFYLSEKSGSTRTATSLAARNWSNSTIKVNGTSYTIQSPTQNPYVEVAVAENNIYTAVLETSTSGSRYGANAYTDLKLPYSQFQNTIEGIITSFPMYASYSAANGNKLIFNDGFALVNLKLKGSAKISSVRIENPAKSVVAGISNADATTGKFTVIKGMDFAALNCTNQGDFTPLNTASATDFYVMVAPGDYTQGLKVSICDSEHGAMFHTIPATTLEAGQVYTINREYACEEGLVFYEGFDNFVWGGDYVKGYTKGKGFAPDATSVTYTNCLSRTGYEEAFTQVNYNIAGTGFIQSNTWADVSGKSVNASHQVPDSYIKSRNIGDFLYLFRTQEGPGHAIVGAGNNGRGIIRLPMLSKMKSIGTVKITVKFVVQADYTSDSTFETNVLYGGVIKEAYLNGVKLNDNLTTYLKETAKNIIPRSQLTIPTSATIAKEWNTLEIILDGATNGTTIHLTDTSLTSSKTHGIYFDSIEVREIENRWAKSPNTLRVLMWNIQNGMCADQHNNYDNFVAWVQKWNPDICIWCESETIYKNMSGNTQNGTRYLPSGWTKLCKSYGHTYAYTGGNRDNYSQTVTSKYPITNVQKITTTSDGGKYGAAYISHGAGHCTITVEGKKINIVTCHMWPQAYAPDNNTQASKDANEGDYFREYEMKYIVNNTVKKPTYASEEYWILGGDTNSKSPKDKWHYGSSVGDEKYLPHKYIIENTNLKDVIADYYPSGTYFMSSTYGDNRIDIMYASPSMFNRITNSIMLMDEWTSLLPAWSYHASFRDPSDHRPVLVDFNMQ
ncbi:MAG: metal-dependent hydrolase [Alistipes sp.]|nr:metal-dependent hydrolase [Alistipes sp.]